MTELAVIDVIEREKFLKCHKKQENKTCSIPPDIKKIDQSGFAAFGTNGKHTVRLILSYSEIKSFFL